MRFSAWAGRIVPLSCVASLLGVQPSLGQIFRPPQVETPIVRSTPCDAYCPLPIERLMRDWQGRNRAVGNDDVAWPKAERSCDDQSGGTEPPPFPPDGLYDAEKCNPFTASYLVKRLLDEVYWFGVLDFYFVPPGTGPAPFEGIGSVGSQPLRTPRDEWLQRHDLLGAGGQPPEVSPDNYCVIAQRLDDLFQELTQIDVSSQIDVSGQAGPDQRGLNLSGTHQAFGCAEDDGGPSCIRPTRGQAISAVLSACGNPPDPVTLEYLSQYALVKKDSIFPEIVYWPPNTPPNVPVCGPEFPNGCYRPEMCAWGGHNSSATIAVAIPSVRGQGELYKNVGRVGGEPWFFMPGRKNASGGYIHEDEYERLGTFQAPTRVIDGGGTVTVGGRAIGDTPYSQKSTLQEDQQGQPPQLMQESGERGWKTKEPFLAVLRPEFERTPDDVILQRANCTDCGLGR